MPWINTGNERTRVSVAFCASAAGHKLTPIILIPRKKPLKNFVPPNNVRVVYGTSGTFNNLVIDEEFVKLCQAISKISDTAPGLYHWIVVFRTVSEISDIVPGVIS